MMKREDIISKNVLENMSDGVMTVDMKGEVIVFNPAAAKILGLRREDVLGRKFAEIFFDYQGNDDFNQTILDAIYESSITHSRTVDFHAGEKTLSLLLTTSFLQSAEAGEVNKVGVIAVFNDITEVKRLGEEFKLKHKELQESYLKLEDSSKNLEIALKRVQALRIFATIFIIAIFLSIGFYTWSRELVPLIKKRHAGTAVRQDVSERRFKIEPQPVSSTLSLTGALEPLHVVNITSPLSGKTKEIYFRYGEVVKAGQLLLKMDTSESEVKYRDAKAAYIKAADHLKELENWESGAEVSRSRRSLTRAKLTLENQKKTFEDTERLFKKGIVPAGEYESAKQQYTGAQLDYQTAQEEVEAIIAKGNEDNRKIARFEMENAQVKLKDLEMELDRSTVSAPVSGVIILTGSGSEEKNTKKVEKGASFQQGDILFSIGDLTGLSVKSRVDESDITKIKEGQKVRVKGDAFPGISLNGKIYTISSQASKTSGAGGGLPSFEITVSISELTPEQRKRVFVGMSANIEVIIYENSSALMIPISAVIVEGDKRFVKNVSGERIEIRTGYTTLDSVEILKGLNAGDEILAM